MILALVKACQDQINRSQLIGLGNSTVLGEFLACPARFERATYALEEFVAAGMCIYFNCLQRKNATV
jgi:hypothetical protein